MGEAAITSAFEAVNNFMLSEEQRLAYINREMSIMDYNTNIKASREEGIEKGILTSLRRMMRNLKLSPESAMDALEITGDDRKKYFKALQS